MNFGTDPDIHAKHKGKMQFACLCVEILFVMSKEGLYRQRLRLDWPLCFEENTCFHAVQLFKLLKTIFLHCVLEDKRLNRR